MQNNFRYLDATRPNVLAGTRTNYFASAAESVQWREAGTNRIVVFSDYEGIKMKYFGGTIYPKKAEYLTIPVTAESYGRSAKDFPEAKVLWGRNGPYGIGRITRGSIATIGEGSARNESHEVLFIFKKEVTIPADKSM
ncbi:hypothetical protein, partial [Staphylococcus aureus]|uniref:hypothetical protein n=1 Tax=Staphylococcus aureus TaxID=1280 RepID=UPI0039BDEDDC